MSIRQAKARAVGNALLWAVLILLFPITSGVIATFFQFGPIATRLLQAAFMLAAFVFGYIYIQRQQIKPTDLFLRRKTIPRKDVCLPLLMLVPMLLKGIVLPSFWLLLATLLFVAAVGLAEELYFRGIGLCFLRSAFSKRMAIIISALIFGLGHSAVALANPDPLMVGLIVLNALLYGFFAAGWAINQRSIRYLMLHHALFNLTDYLHNLSAGDLIIAYYVRGGLILIIGLYYWQKLSLKHQQGFH
ncbi:MAG TPA: CPBP family intramembrane metalloprotease [Tissierellia bacterium]|nr:CPBP family intramembrane metalloprotease [Tissierellia bacterium]